MGIGASSSPRWSGWTNTHTPVHAPTPHTHTRTLIRTRMLICTTRARNQALPTPGMRATCPGCGHSLLAMYTSHAVPSNQLAWIWTGALRMSSENAWACQRSGSLKGLKDVWSTRAFIPSTTYPITRTHGRVQLQQSLRAQRPPPRREAALRPFSADSSGLSKGSAVAMAIKRRGDAFRASGILQSDDSSSGPSATSGEPGSAGMRRFVSTSRCLLVLMQVVSS